MHAVISHSLCIPLRIGFKEKQQLVDSVGYSNNIFKHKLYDYVFIYFLQDFHQIFMAGGVKNITDPDHNDFLR